MRAASAGLRFALVDDLSAASVMLTRIRGTWQILRAGCANLNAFGQTGAAIVGDALRWSHI